MTALLIGLTGYLLGIVTTLAVAQRILSEIMDERDERDQWSEQYGPPTTPEQRRTQ